MDGDRDEPPPAAVPSEFTLINVNAWDSKSRR
jgi:hypothetical protein